MSVRMTMGIQRVWGALPEHDPVTLYNDTDGMAFGPTFRTNLEADAFLIWFAESDYGELSSTTADKYVADVWRRVWPRLEANPYHEHDPGCEYRAQCSTCSWTSNWGDSDNAHSTGWDHKESRPGHVVERTHR